MNNIKRFNAHNDYINYMSSENKILPNISYCEDNEEVHYSSAPPPVTVYYNIQDISQPTPLFFYYDQYINLYEVDDKVLIESTPTTQSTYINYQFDSVGEHYVRYWFYPLSGSTEPNNIGGNSPIFFNTSIISRVYIPNYYISIGPNVFLNCAGLTSITIGNSVTSIGNSAFNGCTGLTSITIPDSVTSIGNGAFEGCTSLTSVTIGNGVTTIGGYAFTYCGVLTSIGPVGSGASLEIPNSVTSIGQSAFRECTGLTSVSIPDSVTSISGDVFSGCIGITSVTIGNSVTSISERAFYNCRVLESITSMATTAPTIATNTFRNVKTGGTLTVPTGSTGYDVWMGTGNYYLGKYNWTKVEQ